MVLLRGSEVETAIRLHLGKRALPRNSDSEAAITFLDSQGRTWLTEVEGNRGPGRNPLTSRGAWFNFFRCFGRVCQRIGEAPNARFAVGLPRDQMYEDYVAALHEVFRRLGILVVFWVEDKGRVVVQQT